MNKLWIVPIVFFAAFAVPVEAGMQVALKCDLTQVQAMLDKSESDTTSLLELHLQMTDGLAVWKGDLDSALVASNSPMMGFATHERVEQLTLQGVSFNKPKDAGSGISFSNTRGLYFIIVFLENGKKQGAAIPVNFSPFGVAMGPPDDRWHRGGYFYLYTGDWKPWQNNGG